MTILKFQQKQPEPPFFKEVRQDGYYILDLNKLKVPYYYPKELPDYPGVNIKNLEIDDMITIRVFFKIGKSKDFRVDGGLIDLRVEFIEEDKVLAVITTQLHKEFSLGTGDSIEVYEEEILYKSPIKDK